MKNIETENAVLDTDVTLEPIARIGFGGGCHWCTEAVFQSLRGVCKVQSGWIASKGAFSSESEAVVIKYAPDIISLEVLMEIHMLTHSSYSNHSMREKYRSAVYVFSDKQDRAAQRILQNFKNTGNGTPITMTLPFISFREISDAFRNYYYTNPNRPFCKTYIEPKLQKIFNTHGEYVSKKP